MITAHAALDPASAEADVLGWLEDLGLDVVLGEATHLLAFEGGTAGQLTAEVDFYALDGGRATQVRWHLRGLSDEEGHEAALASSVRLLLEDSPVWCIDGVDSLRLGAP